MCVTEEYDREGEVVFDCIFLLQKKMSDYAKREIRTSLPSLGNITMCIFSPARIAFLSLSLSDQDRPPLWRHHHHAPPAPPSMPSPKPVPMVAPAPSGPRTVPAA